MTESAYIHIPFCKQKCNYCSFVSFPKLELKEQYLQALKKEIKHHYQGETLKTIYFGGGTPSLLSVDELKKLLELFNFDKQTEITAELNPESLTQEYLCGLKEIGINRISIGCQTFDDNILKIIGRKHKAKQVEDTVKWAKNAGFDNISLDFIYGLPNQTIYDFEQDLRHAVSLDIQHISLYGLKIDSGSYFYKNPPENLPNEDDQADMYLKAVDVLKNFEHYEISNFGKPSKHNLNYWNNENYYGFGIAAHGYINKVRYSNYENFQDYFLNPIKHYKEHTLTQQEILEEEIFLGFRKMKGINIQTINDKFDIDFEKKYSKILEKYNDFLTKTTDGYAFNTKGILISNFILSEFID